MKHRILIANRGEIALRIMEACEELGLEYVAVYTRSDEESLHVTRAPRKYRISDYRDPNEILAVADEAGCTAIHPGYGFLAEDFRFARRAVKRSRPLIFIGPRWEVIRDLGNKLHVKRLARELEIPVIPGTSEPLYNEIEAEARAEELFDWLSENGEEDPRLLIKAAAGGGGMGIEEVRELDEVRPVFRRVRAYAKRLFGDEGVVIEVRLRRFQHLEVQLLGTPKGELVHFGTRNCTIQSPGRQKRVELAPGFDPRFKNYDFEAQALEEEILSHSLKLAEAVGYDNVGTWEWLVTPEGKAYLMEVNTRIQVENEISARIARIKGKAVNLIREQIRVALGDSLGYAQKDITFEGTAIELRLVAEDPERGFRPLSGVIEGFHFPEAPWLTVRTHVPRNRPYQIPTEYDPNLALAIVWGKDTPEALSRAREFLDQVTIEGRTARGEPLVTNVPYLRAKLSEVYEFVS
ncbi:acetyl-CoA carboxylase biotin carboxylase subunit [Thermosulfurimonas marina]|uniref:biotin carboxylase n=1 Tax=Thermosulfurimonas marina TaxID=2047767 RepID=A0A6H1WQK3_9BACT|nr:biotin carboxylase N-terminal domain-containing protein [Thermosulfurimonas marina]QJA05463.1 acetyl-CoA carboxylase biotin carboxylase subunit [Thermosulfurimonas marina]